MADESGRRWRALLGRVALGLFLFVCMNVVINGAIGRGPVDYRMVGVVGGFTMLCAGVVMLPALAVRLRRTRTVTPLSPWRAAAFVAAGLVAVAAVFAWKGVVQPWAPVASATEAACPALERAGLAQAWPDAPRSRTRDDVDPNDLGVFSYCSWTMDTPDKNPSFVILNSFVWLYEGTRLTTALGWATGEYRDRYDDDAARRWTIDGIGDEAFGVDTADKVTVVARRANVLVQVEIYPSAEGSGTAESLVRRMVAGIRVS
jgi:hypothetical protein